MEWMASLKTAVNYMEGHLLEDIQAEDVAAAVHMSPFYLQKGFRILTGYSIGGYIRCRRLYLAALELCAGSEIKVIDLAAKYGYDTPDSFTKAFRRFHGVTPAQMRKDHCGLRPFLPLKITIQVQGGSNVDVTVERMKGFQVIGFSHTVCLDSAYGAVPELWDAFQKRYMDGLPKSDAINGVEEAICRCGVGEFGICIEEGGRSGAFRYLIAGTYRGGPVPPGMELYTIPEMEWAKFRCLGPMPGALQAVNTKIFREWLPGNADYEIAAGLNVEWYSRGDMTAPDYESEIWVPVARKNKEGKYL